jgi:ribosomal protein S18 acetylase RimI-like enzyme
MPVIRLTPEHAAAYRALILQAYALHPDAFTTSASERTGFPLGWWENRLAAGDDAKEVVFGAWEQGALVGLAGLSFEPREKARHKATLFGMYVDAPYRSLGLGRQLVAAVLDYGRSRDGTLLVQLTVTEGNAAAVALYTSFGFAPFGTEPFAVRVGSGYVAKVHMWCRLHQGVP